MAPSKKQDREIEGMAEAVVFALRERGFYHLPNDEPGFAAAVASKVRLRVHHDDLKIEEPLRGFGGEYFFRSASHLGTKTAGSAE